MVEVKTVIHALYHGKASQTFLNPARHQLIISTAAVRSTTDQDVSLTVRPCPLRSGGGECDGETALMKYRVEFEV